jgi:hypothetical protein
MAEREGFEPSNGLTPLLAFQASAFDQLSHLSTLDDKYYDALYYTMKRSLFQQSLK